MLIREIIQRIQSLYSKGVQSDDTRLSSRHIYNKLLTLRSKYISIQAKKKQKINQWNFQTLGCVEVIKTNIHTCKCIPPTGCMILRTKYPLPKPLVDLNRHIIQSVTSIDGSIIFSEIQWDEVKYKSASKYTAYKPDFFIRDGYLYIVGLTQRMRHLKTITVTGLFEDPVAADSMIQQCDCKNKYIDTITKSITVDKQTITSSNVVITITKTISVPTKTGTEGNYTIEEVDKTFTWTYTKIENTISTTQIPYEYSQERYDCCNGSEIVKEEIEIPIPLYTINTNIIPKVKTVSYMEAYYTSDGSISEREVSKDIQYNEEVEDIVGTTNQYKTVDKEICIEDCTSILDKEFHIDSEMIDPIVGEAVQELVSYFKQNKEDVTNNSRDRNVEENQGQ